jgi:Cu/Ag efflux protein CusF
VSGAALAYQDHGHQHHGEAQDHMEAQFTAAEVVEVDTEYNEVVLRHDTIEHLDMPAMTMAFSLADDIDISALEAGDEIKVKVERQGQRFVITEIRSDMSGH